jgi:O-antigen ligase
MLLNLLAFTCPLLFAITLNEPFATPKHLFFVLVAATLFMLNVTRSSFRVQSKLDNVVMIWFLTCVICTLTSIQFDMSLYGHGLNPMGLITCLSAIIVYFSTTRAVQYFGEFGLTRVIALGTLPISLYAISQFFNYDPIEWHRLVKHHMLVRPVSTVGQANCLGTYLLMALPFTLLSFKQATERKHRASQCVYLFAALASVIAVVCTQSRAAWIGLAIFAVIEFRGIFKKEISIWYALGIQLLALTCVVALFAFFAFKPEVIPVFTNRVVECFQLDIARREWWAAGFRAWLKHPILGWGLDTFQLSFNQLRSAHYWAVEPAGSPTQAHNEFVNIAATQGLAGLSATALVIWQAIRTWKRSIDWPTSNAAGVSLLMFVLACLSGYPKADLVVLAAISLGLLGTRVELHKHLLNAERERVAFGVCAIALFAVFTLNFDMHFTKASIVPFSLIGTLLLAIALVSQVRLAWLAVFFVGLLYTVVYPTREAFYTKNAVIVERQCPAVAGGYYQKAAYETKSESAHLRLANFSDFVVMHTGPSPTRDAMQRFALNEYQNLLARNPNQAYYHYRIGINYGRNPEGLAALAQAMALEPANPNYARAYSFVKDGK